MNHFWWVGEDLVFPSLRLEADRVYRKSGRPLTVLQKLSKDGGEAQELLRIKWKVSEIYWVSPSEFYFVASYSALWARLLEEHGGDEDKALKALQEENDYMVFDEIPFWENGVGVTNKVRSRLYHWKDGEAAPVTDAFSNISNVQLMGPDRDVL